MAGSSCCSVVKWGVCFGSGFVIIGDHQLNFINVRGYYYWVHSFGEIAPTTFTNVASVCWAVPVINTTGIEDPTNLV